MSPSKLVILSDIHANLTALNAVIDDFVKYSPDGLLLLGDVVNYGMRPNETIDAIEELSRRIPILVSIRGNHDDACLDTEKHLYKFAEDRGRRSLLNTSKMLNENSIDFIQKMNAEGMQDLVCAGNSLLCVHGDLNNPLWGRKVDSQDQSYAKFDYVLSGHSHKPHFFEVFYDDENVELRNKKKTTFINPGSVGQPRNHNPCAQYVYLDVENNMIHFNSVKYDINAEMSLYDNTMDTFYKTRLIHGI